MVQLLFTTGRSFTVDGLREKLREFYREEVRGEARAAAALTNVELITAFLECNRQLASAGLQLRISNGVVSLLCPESCRCSVAETIRWRRESAELATRLLSFLSNQFHQSF
ncbi:MAG: hypothetical protein M3463_10070 [Verrucomicrobiota bacterium]|nr:hypothetical protein [Verrucomicrobiota bacterium]